MIKGSQKNTVGLDIKFAGDFKSELNYYYYILRGIRTAPICTQ